MQSLSWAPEHSTALGEFVRRGLSYADAADAVNARFGTAYTRSAAIGRAKRMGLVVPGTAGDRLALVPRAHKQLKRPGEGTPGLSQRGAGAAGSLAPAPERAEPVKLRCVRVRPRLRSLAELEDNDCRYPYGGDRDGEAIAFCGHPRLRGSSYCGPHFYLTRAPAVDFLRPAGPFVLRLVENASA